MSKAATRCIAPKVLARISSLELLARGVVEGFIAELHRGPNRGFRVDFMEYRPYLPGDDLQRVDWKLFARSDRYYVGEFECETNARLHLVVDVSSSMSYSSGNITKREYAFFSRRVFGLSHDPAARCSGPYTFRRPDPPQRPCQKRQGPSPYRPHGAGAREAWNRYVIPTAAARSGRTTAAARLRGSLERSAVRYRRAR